MDIEKSDDESKKLDSQRASTSTKLDKTVLSNLNKSLKVKQKIINTKEPLPKNPVLMSDMLNRSPQASAFPSKNASSTNLSNLPVDTSEVMENIPQLQLNEPQPSASTKKPKKSKSANPTRTDIFAAKLASAVDDVDSSDSDETFVYENNNNEITHNEEEEEINDDNNENNRPNEQDINSSNSEIDELNDTDLTFNVKTHGQNDNNSVIETEFDSPPHIDSKIHAKSVTGSIDGYLVKGKPNPQRTASSYSINEDNKRPLSPFITSSYNSPNTYNFKSELDNYNSFDSEREREDNDEDREADDEEDDQRKSRKFETEDEIDVDDLSSHESFTSSKQLLNSSNTTAGLAPTTGPSKMKTDKKELTNSITSKGTKKRSTTSSSKLRSTASKLFDKKGSQPRRYSIIPDDIDIEDFDDELIYYDNNIRFPYNTNNTINTNNNSLNFNENSLLINNQQQPTTPRIPHYRSLNLNPQKRNKAKRYLSTGQQINTSQNQDIFPFPYPEQPNQSSYYYGFDEYDEESGSLSEQQFDKLSRKHSTRFYHPNNNNSHFVLPRKQSFSYVKKTIYTTVSIISILIIGFLMGFFIATTKDLSNVTITEVQNPIVSQDELIFNILVEAINPGWFTIGIKDVELDIFARSGYLPSDPINIGELSEVSELSNQVETVLLGTITQLETEMTFQGVIFNRDLIQQVGEIKLLLPGKNITDVATNDTLPDNSAKWQTISKNPFDLIIRGTLKYSLPLSKNMKSVAVTKTSYIDPTME